MTITRIKRKIKKNKIRAKDRKKRMKYLLSCSSLKNIDIESIKEEFKKNIVKQNLEIIFFHKYIEYKMILIKINKNFLCIILNIKKKISKSLDKLYLSLLEIKEFNNIYNIKKKKNE